MREIHPWVYAVACVVAPVAWGLVMFWAAARLEALFRRRAGLGEGGAPASPATQEHLSDVSPEYHI